MAPPAAFLPSLSLNSLDGRQGEEAGTIAAFLGREELALANVLVDPQSGVGAKLGQSGLPTTLFFDAWQKSVLLHP